MWGDTTSLDGLLMKRTSNILTGLLAAALGGVLIFWVTPAQTVPAIFATVPSGFYPNFTSGMLILSGLALAISGLVAKQDELTGRPASHTVIRFSVSFILLVAAMFAAPIVGFVPAGVGICLITLLLMRENRWALIAVISIAAPLLVWAVFEILLGRPLP